MAERAPISTGYLKKAQAPNNDDFLSPSVNFTTCWSRYGTRKNSATLLAPVAFRFRTDGNSNIQFSDAENSGIVSTDFSHDGDQTYAKVKDAFMVKLIMPWLIDENSGTNFVIARHINNTSMMNVLSGVTSFKASPSINVFNLVNKVSHQYEVAFKMPLIGIYPMSNLPMHVETYHDTAKYEELKQKRYLPHYRASAVRYT